MPSSFRMYLEGLNVKLSDNKYNKNKCKELGLEFSEVTGRLRFESRSPKNPWRVVSEYREYRVSDFIGWDLAN